MPLFNQRVIDKHIKHIKSVPPEHAQGLSRWAQNLERGIYDSETQSDGEFIQRILVEILGYVGSSEGQKWTVAKNQPVGKGNVDVALGYFTANSINILAPMELKGAKTRDLDSIMPGRNKSPVQQAWEYAMDAKGARWVLVSNYREIRLYAIGYGRQDFESFELSKLLDVAEYARFILLLSAENLLGGQTLSLLTESEKAEKDITNQLYSEYKALRRNMIQTITVDNPTKCQLDIIRCTQTILDRILFVAFAEDKDLVPGRTLARTYESQNLFNPQPLWENFKGLFQAINKGSETLKITGYNGGLFADDPEINGLIIRDEICESFKNIGEYNFDSEVSVNILGHIFEQSIADIEELKAEVLGTPPEYDKKKSKRKRDGIFYTPAYITRYIVEHSVGGWLADMRSKAGFHDLPVLTDDDFSSIKITGKRVLKREQNKNIAAHISAWAEYKDKLSNIKVLDPACGSGAFLNEVFDFLKKEGQIVNNELSRLTGGQIDLFRWDTHILANNIYGVDVNRESVEITKLSLWLKTASKNEKLTYLDHNIKFGNSLVDDESVAADAAFKWSENFPEIIAAGGFDVVVGNPPWGAKFENIHLEHIRHAHKNIIVRMINSYMFFIHHAIRITKTDGYNGWVVPDAILYQSDNEKLRNLLLSGHTLKEIINIGDAFDDVVQPCAIFVVKNSMPTTGDTVFILDTSSNKNKSVAINTEAPEIIDNQIMRGLPGGIWPTKHLKAYPILSRSDYKLSDFIDADGIQRGVSPDFKQAFILTRKEAKDAALEPDYLRPTVTGGDEVKKFLVNQSQKLLIYTTKSNDPTTFPNIIDHISRFKDSITCTEVIQGKHPIYTLHRPRDEKIFRKKIKIIGVITGDQVITAVDESSLYPTDGIYIFAPIKPELSNCFVAILNSKLLTFLYRLLSGETGRVLAQVKPTILGNLPFPNMENLQPEAKALEDLGLAIKESLIELGRISANFTKLLSIDFHSLPGNLPKEWYQLSTSGFITWIEKQIKPKKLSLQQKSEWMQHFELQANKIGVIRTEIDRLEGELNKVVYQIYKLSSEEIGYIESAMAPPKR